MWLLGLFGILERHSPPGYHIPARKSPGSWRGSFTVGSAARQHSAATGCYCNHSAHKPVTGNPTGDAKNKRGLTAVTKQLFFGLQVDTSDY